MIKNLMSNWKTSSAGVTMIVGGVVHLVFAIKGHALTESDCTTTVLAIVTGAGLLAAGDAGKSTPGGGGVATSGTQASGGLPQASVGSQSSQAGGTPGVHTRDTVL